MESELIQQVSELKQENIFHTNIINNLPHYIFWKDKQSKFLGCNKVFANSAGFTDPKDVIGKTDFDMPWGNSQAKNYIADDKAIMDSGQARINYEEIQTQIDESFRYMLVSKVPIYNASGEIAGILGIYNDITELRLAQQKAEAASKAKSEFLANLSHDLRTPLSSVASLAEQLTNRIQDPELNKLATEAQSCAEQLMLLIDEILEITEIDLGSISRQEKIFSLDDLVEAVFDLVKTAAIQKGLMFNYQIDKQIPQNLVGKSLLLHRVILNLLSNAIKFTHQGRIDLSAKLIHQQGPNVTIEIQVADTGIGIPKDKFAQIFEQFERLSSAYEGTYEGRGLGLYIVKQFIEALGGEISLNSTENKGTTFIVTVPFKLVSAEDESKAIKQFHQSRKNPNSVLIDATAHIEKEAKILLVEDTEIAKKVAVMTLEKLTKKVDVAVNGTEAIQKATANQYDLIFLDIGLPDMSGIDAAKRIREFEQTANRFPVPIIALTAHLSQSSIQTCLNAGIQQVIIKPLSLARATALFENWLDESFVVKNISQNTSQSQDKSKAVEKEIEQELLKQLPDNRNKIVAAFATQNRETLRDAVHYLHGPTRYTKMKSLQQACNSLESAIIDNFSQEEINELYDDLLDEIQKALQAGGSLVMSDGGSNCQGNK